MTICYRHLEEIRSMKSQTKLGLALSGGGAKGAYQAGIVKYLAEQNIQPDAVSGASIGSLNGAVVASAVNIKQAANDLEKVWLEVAEHSPLKVDPYAVVSATLRLFVAATGGVKGRSAVQLLGAFAKFLPEEFQKYLSAPAFLDNSPTVDILNRYARLGAEHTGLPFWLSAYQSDGAIEDLLGAVSATLGLSETKDSDFIHMNPLSTEDKRKALLASSAIPLAFEAQQIDGKKYYDGGLGGWNKSQGNTPVSPLVKNERCTHVIVTHLEDGSFWNRRDFDGVTFLEIRPTGIAREGLKDMLMFDRATLLEWMEQGYNDTRQSIGEVLDTLTVFKRQSENQKCLNQAAKSMSQSLDWLKD